MPWRGKERGVHGRSRWRARDALPIALALAWLAAPGCSRESQPPGGVEDARRSIVMISLDTLAARHLGLYGYARDTSPNLEAWAETATVFLNAYSTAPKTAESHMSMFTSLYPSVHGVQTVIEESSMRALDEDARSFVQILQQHGYATVGYHDGGNVDAKLGFARGFDVYERGSQQQAIDWLADRAADRPFFLFHHTYFVHDPYLPEPPGDLRFADPGYDGPIVHSHEALGAFAKGDWVAFHGAFWQHVDKSDPREVAHVRALYDALVAQLDARLARLLEAIDRHAPDSVVAIVADHGEEFGQHGRFTHEQVHGETIQVPFVLRHPERGRGRRVAVPVSLIDLAPTLLDLVGLPAIEQFQGRSLAGHLDGTIAARPVFAEYQDQRTLIVDDRKYLRRHGPDGFYYLASDPWEERNLLDDDGDWTFGAWFRGHGVVRDQLRRIDGRNQRTRRRLGLEAQSLQLPDETARELQALGYLE